jgi:hypothetical protein
MQIVVLTNMFFPTLLLNESRINLLGSIKCIFTHMLENYFSWKVFIENTVLINVYFLPALTNFQFFHCLYRDQNFKTNYHLCTSARIHNQTLVQVSTV